MEKNFALLTALQLSSGSEPKPWMLKAGVTMLSNHIEQRKRLGLPLLELEKELEEAKGIKSD
ncbi:hypothetical protein [Pseudoalteromonas aurantia]|uniref:Uncharacterized protein n=1 Tax=Pseudoalteromonas aurantia TaxID=43654 RepID=A0A5S3V1I8_9GAMM|nr:hypothetical protein [Pseudoalteromonas aurantia]TMO59316.1 hypothetical protein CWC18_16105 [Pseudoalteromonas aurantia]TMO63585.1 hypothetical protein CWC19_19070 [Pseudoalteromonas aurantia]TMO72932.1 hypothetical protein CWC20_14235 [Pseudoalteromonas aurantia]